MTISFRFRLFTTAAVIVALVLAAVMATAWLRVMDFEVVRLDARLCSEAKRIAMEKLRPEDLLGLEADIQEKLRLESPEQLLLGVAGGAGAMQYHFRNRSDSVDLRGLQWTPGPDLRAARIAGGAPAKRGDPQGPTCEFSSFQWHGDPWRAAASGASDTRGLVAANLDAPKTEIRRALQSTLLVEIPIAILLTALGAWLLSAFALRPINRLRESMKAVTPTALDQRLSDAGHDREFADLISAYNTMLERLERSFQQASRFSSDAAHELRTPLTILRGRIEQVRRKTNNDDLRADLSDLLDEVARLSAITRKLLLLAHADAGKLELSLTQVNLTKMLAELVADAKLIAEDKVLTASIPEHLYVHADEILLRQLLNNLLSNSVRYCTPGGFIRIHAARERNNIHVTFANSSREIGQAQRLRLFERFFRGDTAHSSALEGHGLGLSLALEIAKAHNGNLTLQPSPQTEVQLLLSLPAQ